MGVWLGVGFGFWLLVRWFMVVGFRILRIGFRVLGLDRLGWFGGSLVWAWVVGCWAGVVVVSFGIGLSFRLYSRLGLGLGGVVVGFETWALLVFRFGNWLVVGLGLGLYCSLGLGVGDWIGCTIGWATWL